MVELIGLSLSLCVRDILRGEVEEADITKIIARTAIKDPYDWKHVMKVYSHEFWREDPGKAMVIARRLWDTGKIEQPRLQGEFLRSVYDGHWLVDGNPTQNPRLLS